MSAVTVKPLVWEDDGYGNFRAQSIRGSEGVDRLTEPRVIGDGLVSYEAWGIRDAFDSPEAAQAAVEIEIASEIMAATATQPDPRPLSEAEAFALSAPTNAPHASNTDMQEWAESIQQPDPRDEVIRGLMDAVEQLNAACDVMWSDHERIALYPTHGFRQEMQLKHCHIKAISEAQQRLPAALAAAKTMTKESKK